MSTQFTCSSCGQTSTELAQALIILETPAFPRILTFCSQECGGIPILKVLDGLEVNQRSGLRKIVIHVFLKGRCVTETFPDAEVFLTEYKRAERYILEEGDECNRVKYEAGLNNPDLAGFARRLRCLLLSTVPDPEYPKKFLAIHEAQHDPDFPETEKQQ